MPPPSAKGDGGMKGGGMKGGMKGGESTEATDETTEEATDETTEEATDETTEEDTEDTELREYEDSNTVAECLCTLSELVHRTGIPFTPSQPETGEQCCTNCEAYRKQLSDLKAKGPWLRATISVWTLPIREAGMPRPFPSSVC